MVKSVLDYRFYLEELTKVGLTFRKIYSFMFFRKIKGFVTVPGGSPPTYSGS